MTEKKLKKALRLTEKINEIEIRIKETQGVLGICKKLPADNEAYVLNVPIQMDIIVNSVELQLERLQKRREKLLCDFKEL